MQIPWSPKLVVKCQGVIWFDRSWWSTRNSSRCSEKLAKLCANLLSWSSRLRGNSSPERSSRKIWSIHPSVDREHSAKPTSDHNPSPVSITYNRTSDCKTTTSSIKSDDVSASARKEASLWLPFAHYRGWGPHTLYGSQLSVPKWYIHLYPCSHSRRNWPQENVKRWWRLRSLRKHVD
jgi:hypothetical protein